MGEKYHEAMALFGKSGGQAQAEADKHVQGMDRGPTAILDSVVAQSADGLTAYSASQQRKAATTSIVLFVIIVAFIPVLVLIVRRDIQKPLARAVSVMGQLARVTSACAST
jgi:hypothetical protein